MLVVILAAWTAAALFAWALVHVGSRNDPEEWDD